MNYYCLTIRKCTPIKTVKQLDRVLKDYDYYLQCLRKRDVSMKVESHLECVDKKQGYNVHMHCMIKTPATIFAVQKRGFSIKLEKCNSKIAWKIYISKQKITEHDIRQHMYDMLEPPNDSEEYIDLSDAHPEREIYKKNIFSTYIVSH